MQGVGTCLLQERRPPPLVPGCAPQADVACLS